MTPATLSADWPLDVAVSSHAPGVASAVQGEWHLQRRCALTPAQLGGALSVLVAASMVVGIGFWIAGLPVVTLFTGLELSAVLIAFGVHARHAADGERLTLTPHQVRIERRRGARVEQMTLPRAGLRVANTPGSAVVLTAGSRIVPVGELARADDRQRVSRDLRDALAS